jgi:hypothetical protein
MNSVPEGEAASYVSGCLFAVVVQSTGLRKQPLFPAVPKSTWFSAFHISYVRAESFGKQDTHARSPLCPWLPSFIIFTGPFCIVLPGAIKRSREQRDARHMSCSDQLCLLCFEIVINLLDVLIRDRLHTGIRMAVSVRSMPPS